MIVLVMAFLPFAISMWLAPRLSRAATRSEPDPAGPADPTTPPDLARPADPARPPDLARPRVVAGADGLDIPIELPSAKPPDWTALDDIQLDRLLKDAAKG
jgi:hypothetical protein